MGSLAEIFCGSVAGAAGRIIEYPFDTAKVRVQSQDHANPRYRGAIDCIRQTIKAEGLHGLYRGISTPMVGAAAENAVLFYSYGMLAPFANQLGLVGTPKAVLQGCGAGVITSFVLTPIELVKCRIQVTFLANKQHRPFAAHFVEILKEDGFPGLWKGQLGTLLREAGGSAAWFGTHHLVKQYLPHQNWSNMVSGACAGVAYNLALFPADTIKSFMQTESTLNRQKRGFIATGRHLYQLGGIKILYRGMGITCARAAPSSAVIFSVHDWLESYLVH